MEIDCSDTFRRKSDLLVCDLCYCIRMLDEWISIASLVLLKSFSCNVICCADHISSAFVKSRIKFVKTVHKHSILKLLLPHLQVLLKCPHLVTVLGCCVEVEVGCSLFHIFLCLIHCLFHL